MASITEALCRRHVLALVTWALRRRLAESARWRTASSTQCARHKLRALVSGANLRALLWTGTIYLAWSIAAGTAGIFNPYIISTLNAGGQAASVALSSVGFVISGLVVAFVYMRYADRTHGSRRMMWGVGAVLQVVAYAAFLLLPFTVPVIIA